MCSVCNSWCVVLEEDGVRTDPFAHRLLVIICVTDARSTRQITWTSLPTTAHTHTHLKSKTSVRLSDKRPLYWEKRLGLDITGGSVNTEVQHPTLQNKRKWNHTAGMWAASRRRTVMGKRFLVMRSYVVKPTCSVKTDLLLVVNSHLGG